MSIEAPGYRNAVYNLLDDVRCKRDEDITTRAQRELDIQNEAERRISPEIMLGVEAVALVRRMAWLAEHPRRPQRLGGSAVTMCVKRGHRNDNVYGIETPLLFGTEAEYLDGAPTVDGYVFGREPRCTRLTINHKVLDLETGTSRIARRWTVEPLLSIAVNSKGNFVINMMDATNALEKGLGTVRSTDVTGEGFDEYRRAAKQDILTSFQRQHPEAKGWKLGRAYNDKEESLIEPYSEKGGTLRDPDLAQLQARLSRGNEWDYPESLYTFPLGLVVQANDLLGTKRP